MTTPHPLGPLPANNAEFLSTVHGPATSVGPRPRICFFRGDPSPPPGAPRPNWTGEPWSPTAKTDDPAANAYYTLATFRADANGRRATDCVDVRGFVLDDAGTKAPAPDALPLPPSFVIETSPGNHQVTYLLAQGSTDPAAVEALHGALRDGSYCDPGATSPSTRYGRMPHGVNGKPENNGFACRLVSWNPERRYTLVQIALAFNVTPGAPKPLCKASAGPSLDAWHAMSPAMQADTVKRLGSALTCISAEDREPWTSVGHMLKADLPEDVGFPLWSDWSETADNCDPSDLEHRWGGFGPERSGFRGVLALARREYGWQDPGTDPAAMFEGCPVSGPLPEPRSEAAAPQFAPRQTLAQVPPFRAVTFADLATVPSEPQVWWWGPFLPAGHVALVGGHGGAGKSTVGLLVAVCIAAGRACLGQPTRRGRVLFYSAEDPGSLVRRRIGRICQVLGIDPAELAQHLLVLDATEPAPVLFTEQRSQGVRAGVLTPTYEALAQYINANAIDVVVVDNASDAFDGDEINRASVRAFIRALALLVRPRNGAVLLLAHVDKNTSRAGKSANVESYSGSTAWHNSVRSRMFLVETGPRLYELQHQKSNLGQRHEPLTLMWPRDGIPQLIDNLHAPSAADADMRALLALIAEFAGRGEYPSTSPQGRPSIAQTFSREQSYPRHLRPLEAFDILRDAERRQLLMREIYKKPNRKDAERFALSEAGRQFLADRQSAPSAPSALCA